MTFSLVLANVSSISNTLIPFFFLFTFCAFTWVSKEFSKVFLTWLDVLGTLQGDPQSFWKNCGVYFCTFNLALSARIAAGRAAFK